MINQRIQLTSFDEGVTKVSPESTELALLWEAKKGLFPWRLHEMLNYVRDQNLEHIVSWVPGTTIVFKVHSPKVFVETILPRFFQTQTRYKSFQRQLNLWGFQRIREGRDEGGYSHPMFVRGKPYLCRMMNRQKKKKRTVKTSSPLIQQVGEGCTTVPNMIPSMSSRTSTVKTIGENKMSEKNPSCRSGGSERTRIVFGVAEMLRSVEHLASSCSSRSTSGTISIPPTSSTMDNTTTSTNQNNFETVNSGQNSEDDSCWIQFEGRTFYEVFDDPLEDKTRAIETNYSHTPVALNCLMDQYFTFGPRMLS